MAKKVADPLGPTINELSFEVAAVPALPPAVVGVLAAINRHAPVSIVEVDPVGEWFRLQSQETSDGELFNVLRRGWSLVCGRQPLNFALICCDAGKDSGVWLHHLSNGEKIGEYLHGCHRIPSWF